MRTLIVGLVVVVGLLPLGLTRDARAIPMQIIQLTNNSHDDRDPQVSGSNVVWSGSDGHDREIFLYEGDSITQITDNEHDDLSPKVSGSNVVWYGIRRKTVGQRPTVEDGFGDGMEKSPQRFDLDLRVQPPTAASTSRSLSLLCHSTTGSLCRGRTAGRRQ